eukprot:CAMPEP_0119338688 /NCGR_PEP_ID=MMETSP1333-20130426/96663_1 /TAXON_ID=418940 /ORGANISM="Scyphosphaera apsteinii, Strain RCC1455" /LENGTH=446 /DNA_ID=CAMNT_0007350035 /DNA_START=6 /DNA_END=1346 /DNA_ORIENTATION=+
MRVTERATASYENRDEGRFWLTQPASCHQFANLYFSRLGELAPAARAAARAVWGDELSFVKTLDVDVGVPVLVIGTLYKDMAGKPNIFKEVMRDALENLQDTSSDSSKADKYCGEGDIIFLEDESGRIALAGAPLQNGSLVTGVIVAVRGQITGADGVLQVDDICFPGIPAQLPHKPPSDPGDRYVCLVSGLHMGHMQQDMLPLMLLSEYLTGQLGGFDDHRLQASIVRLVIAGNVMCDPIAEPGAVDVLKKMTATEQQGLAKSVHSLDTFLTAVCAALPVDLMPGSDDPCNYLLPQQPLHHCLLPQASRLATLNLCTNPHHFTVGGVSFLGSSGQPIEDMQRYSYGDERLQTLTATIHMQHMAPTAPDTLGCYPFATEDPFIIRECPHVYFAGNQPSYQTALVDGTKGQRIRVVTVPDFAQEASCVLINLRTLESQAIHFNGLER